jgi:hypothetical protein
MSEETNMGDLNFEDVPIGIRKSVREIADDDRLVAALESAIEIQREALNVEPEEGRWYEYEHVGFTAADLNAPNWTPTQLVNSGVAYKTYNTSSKAYWRLARQEPTINPEENYGWEWEHIHEECAVALDAICGNEGGEMHNSEYSSLDQVNVDDLFTDVVERDEPVKYARKAIEKFGETQVHHLFYGPPGGGKSEILDEVAEVPGGERVVLSGNQSSAAGIRDVLLEKQPRFLVVEEIEKGSKSDREALMTLCGQGYVSRTKADGADEEVFLDTIVFAASNDVGAITPEALVDRFLPWEFDQYTLEEFQRVCRSVLPQKYDVDEQLGESIAKFVYEYRDSTQVRDAEDVADLADNEAEAKTIAQMTG